MLRRLMIAAAVLAVAACQDQPVAPVSPEAEAGRKDRIPPGLVRNGFLDLTLLHNNDGESDLLPNGDVGGIARFASLVRELKDEAGDCGPQPFPCAAILVSSGDNFLAGPQFNASLELPESDPYFDAVALDYVGYDGVVIGNHEFDFGPDVLADFITDFAASDAPFLSSNLLFGGEPELAQLEAQGRVASSTVVDTDGGPVALIGVTTPALATISSPRNVVVLQDVAGLVNAEVARLESQGVEKIILLSHLQSVAEDRALISMVSGIDIAVAGGGDDLLANADDPLLPGDTPADDYPLLVPDATGKEIPVVTTSGSYRYVGRLQVRFKGGEIEEIFDESGPVRVFGPDGIQPDPFIVANVEQPVAASVAGLQSNVIGTTQPTLDGTRALVRTQETNYGNLIADGQLAIARDLAPGFGIPSVDVALQNGGGIRNSVVLPGGGNITEFDTFQTLPFSNVLSVVEGVTRQRFKEVLENAVSRVEFTDGRFAQIAGFTLEYDPNGQPQLIDVTTGAITQVGQRVRNVTLAGGDPIVVNGVVQSGPALNIAIVNFLAAGGDQYPLADLPATNLGVTYQQVLETFIEDGAYLGGWVPASAYPEGGEGRIVAN